MGYWIIAYVIAGLVYVSWRGYVNYESIAKTASEQRGVAAIPIAVCVAIATWPLGALPRLMKTLRK